MVKGVTSIATTVANTVVNTAVTAVNTVSEAASRAFHEVQEFAEDPHGYITELKCDVKVLWYTDRGRIIGDTVGFAIDVAGMGIKLLPGVPDFLVDMGTNTLRGGINSYLNQQNYGYKVDWGTVAVDSLTDGTMNALADMVGGFASNKLGPLEFCDKGAKEVAGDIAKHWAADAATEASTTMVMTYASDRLDGKSHQEALQNVADSSDEIIVGAACSAALNTVVESATAPKCFVAGTLITTSAGLVAIKNIQPGDVVLAANEETGEVAYKEVVRTFVNTTDEITHVTIENAEGEQETIDSTPEHPFHMEGLGWVEASALLFGRHREPNQPVLRSGGLLAAVYPS